MNSVGLSATAVLTLFCEGILTRNVEGTKSGHPNVALQPVGIIVNSDRAASDGHTAAGNVPGLPEKLMMERDNSTITNQVEHPYSQNRRAAVNVSAPSGSFFVTLQATNACTCSVL